MQDSLTGMSRIHHNTWFPKAGLAPDTRGTAGLKAETPRLLIVMAFNVLGLGRALEFRPLPVVEVFHVEQFSAKRVFSVGNTAEISLKLPKNTIGSPAECFVTVTGAEI
jgi:hypothetical protein